MQNRQFWYKKNKKSPVGRTPPPTASLCPPPPPPLKNPGYAGGTVGYQLRFTPNHNYVRLGSYHSSIYVRLSNCIILYKERLGSLLYAPFIGSELRLTCWMRIGLTLGWSLRYPDTSLPTPDVARDTWWGFRLEHGGSCHSRAGPAWGMERKDMEES